MQPVKEQSFRVSDPCLPFTAFINRDVDVRTHWHTYVEMLYVISGRAIVIIDADRYTVEPGDFLIINSDESHTCESVHNMPAEILVIQFEPSVVNPSLNSLFESKYILPFLQRESNYSKYIKLEKGCELEILLTEILEEFAGKKPGYELNIKGNIYKAFSWLIRSNHIMVHRENDLKTSDLLKLRNVLEYIEENYQEDISNQLAASMVCMSYHHFCRFFKKVTGKTFTEYLNYVRLQEAQKLILSTADSISQIALNVGFPSVSYFNRLFREEKGLSPLAYRKQNK